MAKQFPQSLQTHLDSGTTTLAWCWRFTRKDGAVFGFTDHDRPLAFDGTTFEPESGFTASKIRAGSNLSVDAQEWNARFGSCAKPMRLSERRQHILRRRSSPARSSDDFIH